MQPKSEKTVTTLANAIVLATAIISEVAGNEVADTINGSVVSRAAVDDMVASYFANRLSTYTSQSKK